jgi:diacylglycerol kinase family enzyme
VVPEPAAESALPARLEAAADLPGIEALVVAGGDGTMACAAAVMAERHLPLGVLPLGTMNLLAKDLAIPLDLDGAIAVLRAGATRHIDLGDVNGHVFLTSSQLGITARMARHREAQRGAVDRRGAARFVGGLWRHLGRYPRLSLDVGLDGGATERERLRLVTIVNNDFAERAGEILVREPLDGGRLTLYRLRRLSVWSTLRLAAGMMAGDWHRLPGLERDDVGSVEIGAGTRALRVMNDGEVRLIEQPLRYTVRPKALAVIAPTIDANEDRI